MNAFAGSAPARIRAPAVAKVRASRKLKRLGTYATHDEASAVAKAARQEIAGEFMPQGTRYRKKHGIIRNAMVHQEICDDITAFAASLGCTDIQVFPSSITGGDGNIEFFMGARRG